MKKTLDRNLKAAVGCIILIAVLIALSASNIGWKVDKQFVSSIKLSDIIITKYEGEPYGAGPGIPIHTVTVSNTFFPRMYLFPNTVTCLYNTELKRSAYIDSRWNIKQESSELGMPPSSLEVIRGTKSANLLVFQAINYKPSTPISTPIVAEKIQVEEVYDQLLLFMGESGKLGPFVDCGNLGDNDMKSAIVIPIVK